MNRFELTYFFGVATGVFSICITGLTSPLSRIENIAIMGISGIALIVFGIKIKNKKGEKNE